MNGKAHSYSTAVILAYAARLFAAYPALHLTLLWVNAENYGPQAGIEPAPPILDTGVLASRRPRRTLLS